MILGILQARASSRRLDRKVLLPIMGRPMLSLEVERLKRSLRMTKIILATSEDPTDDDIAKLGKHIGVEVFRGHLNDVLDRFYQAALPHNPDYIVRITGDCPLIDHEIMDAVIDRCLGGNFDYVSNALEPTFPDGLDTEVFRFDSLMTAWKNARYTSEREHVTPYIYNHPKLFKIGQLKNSEDLSYLRWTVDEAQDFDLVKKIYEALFPEKPDFKMADILEYLEAHPEMKASNSSIKRNEGYAKSIQHDTIYTSRKG